MLIKYGDELTTGLDQASDLTIDMTMIKISNGKPELSWVYNRPGLRARGVIGTVCNRQSQAIPTAVL